MPIVSALPFCLREREWTSSRRVRVEDSLARHQRNHLDGFKGAAIRSDLQLALDRALLLAPGKLAPGGITRHPNLRQKVRAAVTMKNELRRFSASLSFRRHAQANSVITLRVGNRNRVA